MKNQPVAKHNLTIVRVAFWGQLAGFLAKAAFLAYEDAPHFFARVSPLAFLVPLVGIAALYPLRLDRFLARNLGSASLVLYVLFTSGATTLLALLSVVRVYRIPEFLVTAGWQYTRVTSVLVLAMFAIALAANVYLIIKGGGSETSGAARESRRSS